MREAAANPRSPNVAGSGMKLKFVIVAEIASLPPPALGKPLLNSVTSNVFRPDNR
jgi:hypothetical protein